MNRRLWRLGYEDLQAHTQKARQKDTRKTRSTAILCLSAKIPCNLAIRGYANGKVVFEETRGAFRIKTADGHRDGCLNKFVEGWEKDAQTESRDTAAD